MLTRSKSVEIAALLDAFPAVGLLGPRQVGKTTLAFELSSTRKAHYLDLESPIDRAKLQNPESYLAQHADKLVILDEAHRMPGLFQSLRGLIDAGIRRGRKTGQFLILGSASIELLKQSSESLAGRIAYTELAPLHTGEIDPRDADRLWIRGGFPDSYLAKNDAQSQRWRQNFIRTYLERDIPMLGPRVPAETLRRFWTMLAHSQGGLLNSSSFARSLAVNSKTVTSYLDLLVDLLLVRRLQPFHANVGKRLVKSPKAYIRDSGLVHALLGIIDKETLLGHPVVGGSWEGFAIENLVNRLPAEARPYFYRTGAGAEIDLVVQWPDQSLWTIEIKRSEAPKLGKGFRLACDDLAPARSFLVHPGAEAYSITSDTLAIPLHDLANLVESQKQT